MLRLGATVQSVKMSVLTVWIITVVALSSRYRVLKVAKFQNCVFNNVIFMLLREALCILERTVWTCPSSSPSPSSSPENNHFLSKEFMGVDTSICLPVV